MEGQPQKQLEHAEVFLVAGERRVPDGCEIGEYVFGLQSDDRMPQSVSASRIGARCPSSDAIFAKDPTIVVSAVVEVSGCVVEPPMERELRNHGAVR